MRLVVGRLTSRASQVFGEIFSAIHVSDLLAIEPFCLLIFLVCLCVLKLYLGARSWRLARTLLLSPPFHQQDIKR